MIFLIIGPTTGVLEVNVKELWVDEKPANWAIKGQKCSIKINEIVRKNDKVYLWVDKI